MELQAMLTEMVSGIEAVAGAAIVDTSRDRAVAVVDNYGLPPKVAQLAHAAAAHIAVGPLMNEVAHAIRKTRGDADASPFEEIIITTGRLHHVIHPIGRTKYIVALAIYRDRGNLGMTRRIMNRFVEQWVEQMQPRATGASEPGVARRPGVKVDA